MPPIPFSVYGTGHLRVAHMQDSPFFPFYYCYHNNSKDLYHICHNLYEEASFKKFQLFHWSECGLLKNYYIDGWNTSHWLDSKLEIFRLHCTEGNKTNLILFSTLNISGLVFISPVDIYKIEDSVHL